MQKLTVTNGMITLPPRLKRAWEGHDVMLEERDSMLTLIGIKKNTSAIDMRAWKKAAGMLKGKITDDPVVWQRKIRGEWDRPLP